MSEKTIQPLWLCKIEGGKVILHNVQADMKASQFWITKEDSDRGKWGTRFDIRDIGTFNRCAVSPTSEGALTIALEHARSEAEALESQAVRYMEAARILEGLIERAKAGDVVTGQWEDVTS